MQKVPFCGPLSISAAVLRAMGLPERRCVSDASKLAGWLAVTEFPDFCLSVD